MADISFSGMIGWIHLSASIVALISGTAVLVSRKGTRRHRLIGYIYVISMVLLLLTAFALYRLFGGFGVFHVAAVISSITIIGGVWPAVRRRSPKWILHHFAWMYWSVLGLYAAFASELLTRLPETPFFGMVGLATGAIMFSGGMMWRKYKRIWQQQFLPQ